MRVIEVRLFKTSLLIDRVPDDRRRWRPSADLTRTAKEIAEFITHSGSSEATIAASNEIYNNQP